MRKVGIALAVGLAALIAQVLYFYLGISRATAMVVGACVVIGVMGIWFFLRRRTNQ
jgi:hypothetical protein